VPSPIVLSELSKDSKFKRLLALALIEQQVKISII
jgi:hypothetical protein